MARFFFLFDVAFAFPLPLGVSDTRFFEFFWVAPTNLMLIFGVTTVDLFEASALLITVRLSMPIGMVFVGAQETGAIASESETTAADDTDVVGSCECTVAGGGSVVAHVVKDLSTSIACGTCSLSIDTTISGSTVGSSVGFTNFTAMPFA